MQSAHRDKCHTESIPISRKSRGRTENCAGFVIRKLKYLRGNRPQKHHKKNPCNIQMLATPSWRNGEMDQGSAPTWEASNHLQISEHGRRCHSQPIRNGRRSAGFICGGILERTDWAMAALPKGSMLVLCVCKLGGFSHSHHQGFSTWRPSPVSRLTAVSIVCSARGSTDECSEEHLRPTHHILSA